jgi:hypothetical protein
MADEKQHIPRGQVPTGTIPRGQIEIVAPPEAKNVVRCKKCGMAMNWDPGLNKWYCQQCMMYYSP